MIVIGGDARARRSSFCVRWRWLAGVAVYCRFTPSNAPKVAAMPLSGMLAAGLAVNGVLHVNGGVPAAGRRISGLSLWCPGTDVDWLQPDEGEPELTYLPSRLWLIGLGHLGQAYLGPQPAALSGSRRSEFGAAGHRRHNGIDGEHFHPDRCRHGW